MKDFLFISTVYGLKMTVIKINYSYYFKNYGYNSLNYGYNFLS